MTTLAERVFLGILDVTRPVRSLFNLTHSKNGLLRRLIPGNASLDRLLRPTVANHIPPDSTLAERHIKNCRVLENRNRLLEHLPKGAVCCEVGVHGGLFSDQILEKSAPRKLHLIELSDAFVQNLRQKFSKRIEDGSVVVNHGDSARELSKFPDAYFDWMYIDADHSYEFVKRELELSRVKLKDGGIIVLNDYICYDHVYGLPYGVVQAANEFCIRYDFEIVFFALHPLMYCDVAIKKISKP